jgi:hypothetical protein
LKCARGELKGSLDVIELAAADDVAVVSCGIVLVFFMRSPALTVRDARNSPPTEIFLPA